MKAFYVLLLVTNCIFALAELKSYRVTLGGSQDGELAFIQKMVPELGFAKSLISLEATFVYESLCSSTPTTNEISDLCTRPGLHLRVVLEPNASEEEILASQRQFLSLIGADNIATPTHFAKVPESLPLTAITQFDFESAGVQFPETSNFEALTEGVGRLAYVWYQFPREGAEVAVPTSFPLCSSSSVAIALSQSLAPLILDNGDVAKCGQRTGESLITTLRFERQDSNHWLITLFEIAQPSTNEQQPTDQSETCPLSLVPPTHPSTTSATLIARELQKEGFHRDLFTKIKFEKNPEIPHSSRKCKIMVLEYLEETIYVDLYQVAEMHRFGACPHPVFVGKIDLEKPSMVSPQNAVMFVDDVDMSAGEYNLTVPVHLRYQSPSSDTTHRPSLFYPPSFFLSCPADETTSQNGETGIATRLTTSEHCRNLQALFTRHLEPAGSSVMGRDFNDVVGATQGAAWTRVLLERSNTDATSEKVAVADTPVGQLADLPLVTFGTLLVTVVAAVRLSVLACRF